MLPLKLELRNFLAYRQPDPVIFEGIHLAALTGPNGAGKSSLLDAITWALWGKARVRTDDDLIYQGQTDMLVQLDFLQGETRYRVVRKRQKGKTARSGRSALDLFVWDADNNTYQSITASSIRETDQKIVELLRLDHETFIHSAFLQQGRADAFTVKTPAQRKEILAEILGLSQWKVYEEHAKRELQAIDEELRVIGMRIGEIEEQEAREPGLLRDLKAAEEALSEATVLREAAEQSYQEVAGAEDQMRAAQNRLTGAQHRIRQREGDLEDIEAELGRYQKQHEDLQALINDRETIRDGYAQLQAARETDQALGEKLRQMSAIKERLNEVERKIEQARADLEGQARVHQDRINSAQKSSDEIDDIEGSLASVMAEVSRLEAAEDRSEELREAINTLKQEDVELDATNKSLYAEMQAIRKRLDMVQAAEAICPTCGQALDDTHKATLLDQLQGEGTERRDTYLANNDRRTAITAEIEAHNAEVEDLKSELRRLPALRERAASLRAQLDTAQSASNTVQEEQAALDVIRGLLEAGEYAQELQQQRQTIEAEIEALGYDSDAHDEARETLSTYSAYEKRQHELEAALTRLPEIESAIENAEKRRTRWQEFLEKEEQEASEAQQEIDGLKELVEEAHRRDEEVRARRTAEKNAQERRISAEQALSALENARKRKEQLLQRQAELHERKGIFEDLRAAFGKNGVPAMIIEAAIPELEETANRLLAQMTGGRMHIRLDTQREKRTGGVAETLDILIADELGTRAYESYSGGEAFRINFAIRVALSQMLARRAGAQLRTLFMDEGFGTQDEAGRQRLVEAINAVQDHFDLLLVITHVEDLRDAFPVQIEVIKTADGSRVTVR